jgi:transposase
MLVLAAMAHLPSHSQPLLPWSDILILDRIEREADRCRLIVHVEQKRVCPVCGEYSRCRHSCYLRREKDLPWQGVSVQLWATVGRLRCMPTQNLLLASAAYCARLCVRRSGPRRSCA